MQAELSCALCGVDYSEDRLPRILAVCGHSFCQVCIEQKIMQDGQGKFYLCCPEDNMRCQINTKDVRQIPINRSLLKIAESAKVKTPHKDASFELSKTTKEEDFQEDMEIHDFKDSAHVHLLQQSPHTKTHFECAELKFREQSQQLDQENMCLLHQKPLEIVCVYDLQKICAKCAIFGQHKGHDFKSLEQIDEEKQQFCESLEAVFELKKEIMNRVENKTTKSDIISILNQKSSNLSKQIKDKFKELIDIIKAQETKVLTKLDQMNRKVEKEIDSLYKIDSILVDKYEDWERMALIKLDEIKNGTFEEQLKLLIKVESIKEKNSLSQGESLVNSIRVQEENIIINSQSLLGSLNLKVNDKIFEFIPSFLEILDSPEEISPVFLDPIIDYSPKNGSGEINLLEIEGLSQEIILPQKVTFSESPIVSMQEIEIKPDQVKLVPFLQGKAFDEKSSKKPLERKTLTKRQFPRQKMKTESSQQSFLYTSRQMSFVSEKSLRLPKKKAKTIKVPQKYQKILEALSADTLQTLDLANAELGDSVMLQICEILSSTKVKTAKLIRNKLTDEGLTKMLPFMGNLVALNLSQNLLTQKILDVLLKNRQMIPHIKNIVLSMNKIVERKDKKKIDELRAFGITVSV